MTRQEKWLKRFGAENVYNKHCVHLEKKCDEYKCKIKMDMMFCGNNCSYASNRKGTLKTDARGKVVGIR